MQCVCIPAPYFLVMEFVAVGTLHNFLQINRDKLSANKDLQHLFTITAYHIAHAMDHLRSKMVLRHTIHHNKVSQQTITECVLVV